MENKRGGAREGAGRPSKADEIKLIDTMDAIAVPDSVWAKLYEKVETGDVMAIKTWLSYRYGMPKQIVEQKNINLTEKDLDEDEIKRIKETLFNAY